MAPPCRLRPGRKRRVACRICSKQGAATQLVVDGKPYLALAGELTNNAATSLPMMEPIWPMLVADHLNTALVGISWAQFEPEEGHFNYTQVDGVIDKARENHMHIVFLWFGAWKNGTSSFAPYWVKKDYTRFPRIQIDDGKTVSISGPVELLSTFGDATRDADAAAFKALMAHIKEVDGAQHTVLMMQVENEVGVLRDSRDRSPAANRAYQSPVPAQLMNYLEAHKDHLMPEFRADWAANGYKSSGTWEEVFGPGKPAGLELPVETSSPPMGAYEHEIGWTQLHWASDEFFMAWNYARLRKRSGRGGQVGLRHSDVRERLGAAAERSMARHLSQRRSVTRGARHLAGRSSEHRHPCTRSLLARISMSSAKGGPKTEIRSSFPSRKPVPPTSSWPSDATTLSGILRSGWTVGGLFRLTSPAHTKCLTTWRQ